MSTDHLHDIPDTVEMNGEKSEGGKLSVFLGILRRFIGVKDISAVRLSLPAQLVEPVGNLEYWGYLDRPDYFASVGESEDPAERMLEVVRFWYTKDLKYVHGKVCKPYNSILGEFFRCKWDVETLGPKGRFVSGSRTTVAPGTSASSSRSVDSVTSNLPPSSLSRTTSISSKSTTAAAIPNDPSAEPKASTDTGNTAVDAKKTYRVAFLCEQILHHPPVSAFYGECREKGISICGNDHISAKFTGTSIKVYPGEYSEGIFLTLKNQGEEYQMTHPVGSITGFISLKYPYLVVQDYSYITCSKSKIKAILKYNEEGWLSKPKFAVEGVVFRYDPENDNITKIRAVPEQDILYTITGSWRGKITYTMPNSTEQHTLVDLSTIQCLPKECPTPPHPLESRQVWAEVTDLINLKEWGRATKVKQGIEAKQRRDAALRKERGEEWIPKLFVLGEHGGRAVLTKEGWDMLETIYQHDTNNLTS